MNSSIGSIGGPDLTHLSARLGTLAGSLASNPHLDATAQPTTFAARVAALIDSMRRQQQARETFKATHFMMAD